MRVGRKATVLAEGGRETRHEVEAMAGPIIERRDCHGGREIFRSQNRDS